jgi:Protein of unknown function (DUF2378)
MNEQIIYHFSINNLLSGSGVLKNPELLNYLRTRYKIDVANFPASMPYDLFIEMADYIRKTVFPHLTDNEGWQKLGYNMTMVNFEGEGRMNKLAVSMLGIEDVMRIFLQTRRANIPFGRQEIDVFEKGYFVYHSYDIPTPPYLIIGIIEAGFGVAGVKEYCFDYTEPNRHELILEVRFTPKF